MKKVFLDTNIVLDFLIREECSKGVRNLIAMPASYNFYISYLTVANVAYILRKYPQSEMLSYIKLLLELFFVIPNTVDQIAEAVKTVTPDFEDMLQYQAALSAGCDVIITRNSKDFQYSSLPVMSVEEYLAYDAS